MALIKCKDCGEMVSENAAICIHCGCPIKTEESKIMIYGYTQAFLLNPFVDIYINNQNVGKVGNVKRTPIPFEYKIDKDCELLLKCGFRKATIPIKKGKTTKIKISWNRITGQLMPQVVDNVVSGDNDFCL
jgi:hypothetical protein